MLAVRSFPGCMLRQDCCFLPFIANSTAGKKVLISRLPRCLWQQASSLLPGQCLLCKPCRVLFESAEQLGAVSAVRQYENLQREGSQAAAVGLLQTVIYEAGHHCAPQVKPALQLSYSVNVPDFQVKSWGFATAHAFVKAAACAS